MKIFFRQIVSLIASVIIIICFFGCKKDYTNEQVIASSQQVKDGPVASYNFNWETSTYLPSSPANQLQMPWNSGSTAIDPNIVSDYKMVDGWKLVWNTFSPTKALNDVNYYYYFALYNPFRGLLRFYLWQPANANATTYINHGLALYRTGTAPNSSMLNFGATEVVDVSTQQQSFVQVLNQQMNAAGGTWLVFQYEISYDPQISSTAYAFPNFGLTWNSQWVNLTSVSLEGTSTGTVKGYLGSPNTSQGTINFGPIIQAGVITFLGAIDYTHINSKYTGAVNNALQKIVSGFFSGLIGGQASNSQAVNLTINTQIQLSGNMVSNGGLENLKLKLPGQSNSQTGDGLSPIYNNIMGVFTLTGRPKVKVTNSYTQIPYEDPYSGESRTTGASSTTYNSIDETSYAIQWNPAVINSTSTGATIQNLKKQIVVIPPIGFPFNEGRGQYEYDPYSTTNDRPCYRINSIYTGKDENVGDNIVCTPNSTTVPLTVDILDDSPLRGYPSTTLVTAVRISFDVVPNNGGKTVTIVKTFKANAL